jgi:hypothetical protein
MRIKSTSIADYANRRPFTLAGALDTRERLLALGPVTPDSGPVSHSQ